MVQRPFEPAPEMQTLLDVVGSLGNDLDTMSPETVPAMRQVRQQRVEKFLWEVPVESVRDFNIPGEHGKVPVRLYVPLDKMLAREGRLPLILFFHGGGWVLGNVSVYDPMTRFLARQTPALVLSADYRLAPEHPFPAAVQDADAVLHWVRHHAAEIGGDPGRIVVMGDSAGGTLATVAAMRARGTKGPSVAMQVLLYPSVNISRTDCESHRQYGTNHLLTTKALETFRRLYLPNPADWTRPEVSPLLAPDLRHMPPALVLCGGCDPLRDETEAYVRKLREHNVRVTYRLEPNLIHAFMSLYSLDPACSPYAEGALAYVSGVVRETVRGGNAWRPREAA